MKYVVEVHAPVVESPQNLARKLVEGFNVRGEIARDLIRLIPGTVTKPLSQQEASTISTMLSGIGLQVSTREVEARAGGTALQGHSTLNLKIWASSLLPVLLALAATLGVVLLTVRPALKTHLLESAQIPAILFASVAERVIGSNSINSWAALAELDAVLEDARAGFQRQNIAFIALTNTDGKPLAGWYGDNGEVTDLPKTATGFQSGLDRLPQTVEIGGQRLEVVAETVAVNGQPVGAVVVGIQQSSLSELSRSVLTTTLLAGLFPVLVAVLLGISLTRALNRNS
jgi:hypothetical protein